MERGRRNAIRRRAGGLCAALAAVLCAGPLGCHQRPPVPAGGGAANSRAEKARKDAEAVAVGGVTGGATAQARAEPETARRRSGGVFKSVANLFVKTTAPPGAPAGPAAPPAPAPPAGPRSTPRSGWVIRERVVSSIPYVGEADAEEDVLAQARKTVKEKLAALDPPVRYEPSPGEVRAEFLRADSRQVRPLSAAEKEAFAPYESRTDSMVYVEYDVEVTADQVRELRAQDRVSAALRVVGALFAVALGGFLFLRADEWTRGHLTRWLALGAVTAAGGAAAALLFV